MALVFVLSVAFGFLLSRSGAADFDVIQHMFLFDSFHMYGLLAVGVGLTAPGLWLLGRYGRTLTGQPIHLAAKPIHGGSIPSGLLFGVGWAMTGMCPGPILVTLGEGKVVALAALAGALLGTWLFGVNYVRIQRFLKLPNLTTGTGAG